MSGVSVIFDEVSPLLSRIQSAAQLQGVVLVGARAVGQVVKTHLFGLDTQRHRGGRHYYAQAARSVATASVPQGAAVTITQTGFRQRLLGGTIRPRKKYLTIPAAPEAYGMRAGEFADLQFALVTDPRSESIRPALVRRPSTAISIARRKGKDGTVKTTVKQKANLGGEVMFWLVRKVTQKADPSVLPYAEQMSGAAIAAMKGRILRLAERQLGGNN